MFLNLFYDTCSSLARLVLNIFYPNTKISNPERLNFEKPCIIVTNHPNTLLDPLHAASRTKKRAHFVVNAGLYKTAFGNWFFSTFYCIPVERANDNSGRKISNAKSMDRCNQFIQDGGCLFIAPQGLSEIKRNIGKLKTGVARIALGAEAAAGWNLGAEILPFGLNYESPQCFRTDMFVNIGEPIQVADYKDLYLEDNFKAVRKLTDDLKTAMELSILNTKDEAEDTVVRTFEAVQQSENYLEPDQAFYRAKKFVNHLHQADEPIYQTISSSANTYQTALDQYQIDDKAVKSASDKKNSLGTILLGILGFPLFIYGVINNLLNLGVPALIVKSLGLIENYDSNVKAMTGLFLWPLFYFIQIRLVYAFVGNWWMALLYGLTIYPTMVFAWKYAEGFRDMRKLSKAKKAIQSSDILAKRNEFLKQIAH